MASISIQYCAGCMSKMSEAGRCMNANCGWDEHAEVETQEHLPRHYVLLDRYYIGRVLGQGGFGVTYIAHDLKLNRTVAIKEFLPKDQCSRRTDRVTVHSYSQEKGEQFRYGLDRFLSEAQNVAKLGGHPNIVSITDYAEANGTAYMVMEFIPGVTLKQYLAEQGGRIPYSVASEIVLHVMSGLNKAHEHGLIHRDVSPDNIMLSSLGPIKLIDFGAARQAVGEKSQNLTMVLKPGYAPEEQYRSRGVQGPWTDVYATAATLYRCITGEVPPAAPDRLAEDELIRPSKLCADLTPESEAVLLKALSVRAADRFNSMNDFREALAPARKPVFIREEIQLRKEIKLVDPPVVKQTPAAAVVRPVEAAVANKPVQVKSRRLLIFFLILGLAIYAVSFLLNAVRGTDASSTPYVGWFCARFTLSYTWDLFRNSFKVAPDQIVNVYAMVFSGWINPLFLLSLLLRVWKRTRTPAVVLTVILAVMQICCWVVFHQQSLIPREGYFLWVAGMLIAPLAGPFARWLGK